MCSERFVDRLIWTLRFLRGEAATTPTYIYIVGSSQEFDVFICETKGTLKLLEAVLKSGFMGQTQHDQPGPSQPFSHQIG